MQTPNGNIVWHSGGTASFGAMIAMSLDKDVGVIVLTNEDEQGFAPAVGVWALDRLLDNPVVDHAPLRSRLRKKSLPTPRRCLPSRPTRGRFPARTARL